MVSTPPTSHGGLDLAELRRLGLRPEEVLDFSASINPLGPPPAVREAVAKVDLAQYPDRQCLAIREALAGRLNVGVDSILMGNGSTELIHLLARACLRAGDRVLIFSPTFGEYSAASLMAGAIVHDIAAEEDMGFQWDLDSALDDILTHRPQMVFLCNPNNPTGVHLDRSTVGRIAAAVPDGGLLVLDEAYVPLSSETGDSLHLLKSGRVVLLHSMTKDYALAGLRLGYMLAGPNVVERVKQLQVTWSVSSVAQAAGVAALKDGDRHVERGRETVMRAKRYLESELDAAGVAAVPSTANFLLAKVGDATAVRTALLTRGICVRDCSSFGLPNHIRIGLRDMEDCRKLVVALKEVLAVE